MNYNSDGFNERNLYINNSNDMNNLKKNGPSNIDTSFVQMKINENKPDIKTVDNSKIEVLEETRGNRENFVVRNSTMNNVNRANTNNAISNALNRNMFRK